MALKDLTLTKEEANEEVGVTPSLPKYPYGLSLDLNDEVLAKLGIDVLPAVGSKLAISAVATVTRISAYQDLTDKEGEQCLGLQITAMEIGGDGSKAASKLYGKS